MRFAASAGTVRRVSFNCTTATVCGSQRDANPAHLWSEVDWNDAPSSAFFKAQVASEVKVCSLGHFPAKLTLLSQIKKVCQDFSSHAGPKFLTLWCENMKILTLWPEYSGPKTSFSHSGPKT